MECAPNIFRVLKRCDGQRERESEGVEYSPEITFNGKMYGEGVIDRGGGVRMPPNIQIRKGKLNYIKCVTSFTFIKFYNYIADHMCMYTFSLPQLTHTHTPLSLTHKFIRTHTHTCVNVCIGTRE